MGKTYSATEGQRARAWQDENLQKLTTYIVNEAHQQA